EPGLMDLIDVERAEGWQQEVLAILIGHATVDLDAPYPVVDLVVTPDGAASEEARHVGVVADRADKITPRRGAPDTINNWCVDVPVEPAAIVADVEPEITSGPVVDDDGRRCLQRHIGCECRPPQAGCGQRHTCDQLIHLNPPFQNSISQIL